MLQPGDFEARPRASRAGLVVSSLPARKSDRAHWYIECDPVSSRLWRRGVPAFGGRAPRSGVSDGRA